MRPAPRVGRRFAPGRRAPPSLPRGVPARLRAVRGPAALPPRHARGGPPFPPFPPGDSGGLREGPASLLCPSVYSAPCLLTWPRGSSFHPPGHDPAGVTSLLAPFCPRQSRRFQVGPAASAPCYPFLSGTFFFFFLLEDVLGAPWVSRDPGISHPQEKGPRRCRAEFESEASCARWWLWGSSLLGLLSRPLVF